MSNQFMMTIKNIQSANSTVKKYILNSQSYKKPTVWKKHWWDKKKSIRSLFDVVKKKKCVKRFERFFDEEERGEEKEIGMRTLWFFTQ